MFSISKYLIIIILIFSFIDLKASDKYLFRGYVKDLLSVNIPNDSTHYIDNLIHNRLNFQWYPNENFTFRIELRNRFYNGDQVSLIENYDQLIDTQNDYFDLSYIATNNNDFGLHMMIDRLSFQWVKDDWEITLGRQRINWGQNLAWNPNDLFNAYSFFDFDYEERPGSDALRISKYIGYTSKFEIAIKAADSFEELTAAALYRFNYKGYDIQLLGGTMQGDASLGLGWSGNIIDAGFKGEISYFKDWNGDLDGISASLSADYSFKNSLYVLGSVLYNEFYNSQSSQANLSINSARLSAKNLLPFEYAGLVQMSYTISPIINASLAFIAFPGVDGGYINPGISISVLQDLDLAISSQIIYSSENVLGIGFLRLKWSF